MAFVLSLHEFGRTFATRERGAELRDTVLTRCIDEPLIVDFAGVTNVSYSFADEFVGRLSCVRPDIELLNMASAVEPIVRRARERRSSAIAY